jgi:hypothetical protein
MSAPTRCLCEAQRVREARVRSRRNAIARFGHEVFP